MKHYLLNPTWRCQLHCSYCWVRKHINKVPALTSVAERPYEDYVTALRRDPPDICDIGGGEPLILPWIFDLIEAFPDIAWGLSTNGLVRERIHELAERKLRNLVNINLSYHPEAGQRFGWYNGLWKEHALLLSKAGYAVGPNLEITDFNLKHGQWAIDWLKANGLRMVCSPICTGQPQLY
ncbi:MAG: radical SAM protein, partial [Phycisphaerae bacterium]